MPIWVLGLILVVITFVALGIGRKRKPDVEGVKAAIEAQKKRQRAQRLKILRAEDRAVNSVVSVFSSRLSELQDDLAREVRKGFCIRGEVNTARSELEHTNAVIEGAISASERDGARLTLAVDLLDLLKNACEKSEHQFFSKTIALSHCCDDIRVCEKNILEEVLILSEWSQERSEAAQERAADLISEAQEYLADFQQRLPTLVTDFHIQTQGIEEELVTPGVIKWREERSEARVQMAL